MTEKRLKLFTNLVFFLVFIPVLTIIVPTVQWIHLRPILYVSVVVYLIGIYEALIVVNIPGHFLRHHYLRGSLWLAGVLALTAVFARFALWLGDVERPTPAGRFSPVESTVWFLFLVILGFSFFNNMLMERSRINQQQAEMAAERDKAELAMYRAQVNPHFLFNTLNTLYALMLTGSDRWQEAFEKFIDICKYSYNNTDADTISVGQEARYLQEYVDLQRMRFDENVTHVVTRFDIDDPATPIAPMLLITFVENAFKYGVSSTAQSLISIVMTVRQGVITFNVDNSHVNPMRPDSTHTGLLNVHHRLDLLYPDRYQLQTMQDADGFHVSLKVNVKS